mmetsp:Transcript_57565/g.65677  ORF Transcript_57565/g.65677 Transcript_57565/m.65677 type:complete len:441 (+) Transcript_57565:91-1413(+)
MSNSCAPRKRTSSIPETEMEMSRSDKDRAKRLLYALAFLTDCTFGIAAPFYPPLATDEHGMSSTMIGIVFAAASTVSAITCTTSGFVMRSFGRKFMISMGRTIQGIGLILFGLLTFIEDDTLFTVSSLALRVFQGVGSGTTLAATMATVASLFQDNLDSVLATLQSCSALGITLAPVIGYILYQLGGFALPFCLLGVGIICLGIWLNVALPEHTTGYTEKAKLSNHPRGGMLADIRVIFAFFISFLAMFGVQYLNPVMSTYIESSLDGDEIETVIGFFVVSFSFIGASIPVSKLSKGMKHRGSLLFVSLVLMGGSFVVLSGPRILPQSILVVYCGVGLMGAACAFGVVPSLPEMVQAGAEKFPESKEDVNDVMSGFFGASLCLGGIAGPILSGILYDHYDFETGCWMVTFIFWATALIQLLSGTVQFETQKDPLEDKLLP